MTNMWNEIMEQPAALERCRTANLAVISEITAVFKARNIGMIVIAARGTSDHAAVYGKYALEILTGIPVSLAAPSVFTMYQKNLKLGNCLVIGISQSGKAADVLEVVAAAKASGALTVAVTNFPESPLAKGAQYHLYCNAGPEMSVAATKTFLTEIYLLALLAAKLSVDEDLKNQLTLLPPKIIDCLEIADNISEKVPRYRFMNECFVLARGLNYAVALEAALKIQETNYVRARAYATSDFYHGPLAMVEKDIPVMVFAPRGPSFADVAGLIHKLKEDGVELLVVSNDRNTLKLGDCSFEIPPTHNDLLSPFFNALVAQIFACKLALVKGLNPDTPRGLKKVTITR